MFQVGDKVLYRKQEIKGWYVRGEYKKLVKEWDVPATVKEFSEKSILIQFDGSTVGKWVKAEKLTKAAVSA